MFVVVQAYGPYATDILIHGTFLQKEMAELWMMKQEHYHPLYWIIEPLREAK